jgi:hypothetical protein
MGALHLISKLRFFYENATQSGSFLKGIVICADLPPILEKHSQLRRRERETLFVKEQKLPPNEENCNNNKFIICILLKYADKEQKASTE